MNRSRALQILSLRGLMGELPYAFIGRHGASSSDFVNVEGITEEEDRYIRDVWNQMNGYASYYDALLSISKAKREDLRYYYISLKVKNGKVYDVVQGERQETEENIEIIAVSNGLIFKDPVISLRNLIEKWNLNLKGRSAIYWFYDTKKISERKVQELVEKIESMSV